MDTLLFFDLFSQKPTLKINGKPKLKNKYVAILGIFVLIGVIILSIILSLDILSKNSLTVMQNISSNKFVNITLDSSLPIAIIITNNIGREIPDADRVYEINSIYTSYKPENFTHPNTNFRSHYINNTECKYKRLEGGKDDKFENLYKISKSMKCFDLKPYNVSIYRNENPGLPQAYLQFF